MYVDFPTPELTRNPYLFERSRLNLLLKEAVQRPLTLVCAGAGYGKTTAVRDFVMEYKATTIWLQVSSLDSISGRFWESFTHVVAQVNKPLADAMSKLGFPDTDDRLIQYFGLLREHVEDKRRVIVFDDCHLIESEEVLAFMGQQIDELLSETSIILISRTVPQINLASLISKDRVSMISEEDLCFNESELTHYFTEQGISLQANSIRTVMQDTEGWAFALNLIARSYQKAPGYEGYLRNAMKSNIFQLMESEVWSKISERLQTFMMRLALIDHLSVDLITLLADGDESLIDELERQSAFVRRDSYINAYLIHHLFLEFIRQKQDQLSEDLRRQTYQIAADWCYQNDFLIDALSFYEKIGDYESVIRVFYGLPIQVPLDIARFSLGIFERAPAEAYDQVELFAVMHVRVLMCLGKWQEALAKVEEYEAKYLQLPADDDFRNHMLGGIYYSWGILRTLLCSIDECTNFDIYFEKMDECLSRSPVPAGNLNNHPAGPWIILTGSSEAGAPQTFINALTRSVYHASRCFNGAMSGLDDLARGELLFYQGQIREAESHFYLGLERARENRQYDTEHRALYYLLRVGIAQGNYEKIESVLKDMEALLDKDEYPMRYVTYDIALTWYYSYLGYPEKVPEWLKDKFSPYGHAYFIENFSNQAKARYFYLIKNYPLLLAFIDDVKQRESIIYGRIEMLVLEACIHYLQKERVQAFAALQAAYEEASPNQIIIPFIGLGKDMRSLTAAAMKEPGLDIPMGWLEEINRKSASFAKRKSHIIAEYRRANGLEEGVVFSRRELEVLDDLSHGLSRMEIAVGHKLSVNTVKMVINNIHTKMGVDNQADLIRIATEEKLI